MEDRAARIKDRGSSEKKTISSQKCVTGLHDSRYCYILGKSLRTWIKTQNQNTSKPEHSLPYALRTNVELELERLQREGIISPVEFSEWAAPIVPVAKPNGTVTVETIN